MVLRSVSEYRSTQFDNNFECSISSTTIIEPRENGMGRLRTEGGLAV